MLKGVVVCAAGLLSASVGLAVDLPKEMTSVPPEPIVAQEYFHNRVISVLRDGIYVYEPILSEVRFHPLANIINVVKSRDCFYIFSANEITMLTLDWKVIKAAEISLPPNPKYLYALCSEETKSLWWWAGLADGDGSTINQMAFNGEEAVRSYKIESPVCGIWENNALQTIEAAPESGGILRWDKADRKFVSAPVGVGEFHVAAGGTGIHIKCVWPTSSSDEAFVSLGFDGKDAFGGILSFAQGKIRPVEGLVPLACATGKGLLGPMAMARSKGDETVLVFDGQSISDPGGEEGKAIALVVLRGGKVVKTVALREFAKAVRSEMGQLDGEETIEPLLHFTALLIGEGYVYAGSNVGLFRVEPLNGGVEYIAGSLAGTPITGLSLQRLGRVVWIGTSKGAYTLGDWHDVRGQTEREMGEPDKAGRGTILAAVKKIVCALGANAPTENVSILRVWSPQFQRECWRIAGQHQIVLYLDAKELVPLEVTLMGEVAEKRETTALGTPDEDRARKTVAMLCGDEASRMTLRRRSQWGNLDRPFIGYEFQQVVDGIPVSNGGASVDCDSLRGAVVGVVVERVPVSCVVRSAEKVSSQGSTLHATAFLNGRFPEHQWRLLEPIKYYTRPNTFWETGDSVPSGSEYRLCWLCVASTKVGRREVKVSLTIDANTGGVVAGDK